MYALTLKVEGASDEDIRRGLDAAGAVFEEAGVHPAEASEGFFAMEGWDIGGFKGDLDEEASRNADIWLKAQEAAVKACCEGWDESRKPVSGDLELIDTERYEKRRADDGSWMVYNTFTGKPAQAVGGGPLLGLNEEEADELLSLIDEGMIELEPRPDSR
ncbi:hypothetical protein [Chelativorans sp.]|uniref:hypothetical protein n=1 Tax=Chelativorans sp. TaxID=2203393 RepID=UPI002811F8F2|nr:hypothetical protein [Chelativorans sp.]